MEYLPGMVVLYVCQSGLALLFLYVIFASIKTMVNNCTKENKSPAFVVGVLGCLLLFWFVLFLLLYGAGAFSVFLGYPLYLPQRI